MPIHGWARVDAGLFHDFHQVWTAALRNALNTGGLPPDYFALIEQYVRGPIPDVVRRSESEAYAEKANRITIRHRHGDLVAVLEIVSPGNKSSRASLRAFVQKAAELLQQGIHLLVVDLLPPGKRDPNGMHKVIWDQFVDEEYALPTDKPLTLASYDAGPPRVAYVEPVAIGDLLPDMPLFLKPEVYVPAPLEATYQATWAGFPQPLKRLLEVN